MSDHEEIKKRILSKLVEGGENNGVSLTFDEFTFALLHHEEMSLAYHEATCSFEKKKEEQFKVGDFVTVVSHNYPGNGGVGDLYQVYKVSNPFLFVTQYVKNGNVFKRQLNLTCFQVEHVSQEFVDGFKWIIGIDAQQGNS